MIIKDLEKLRDFANNLAGLLKDGDVINLIGDMGAGKTTLTSYIAEYFDILDSSSPTFALVNIYDGERRLYHLDLYRLDDPDEILDIDFETYFYPDKEITIIEWAENAKGYLPKDMINIEIDKLSDTSRSIKIRDDSKRGREINEYLSD